MILLTNRLTNKQTGVKTLLLLKLWRR